MEDTGGEDAAERGVSQLAPVPAQPANDGEAGPPTPPTPELLERWLETQNRQLEVQARTAELQFQQDKHAFEFGKLSLEAQREDRKHERESGRQVKRDRLIFAGIIAFSIVGLVALALCLNKDEIAKELVKAVIYLGAGVAGGYGFAKANKKDDKDNDTDEE